MAEFTTENGSKLDTTGGTITGNLTVTAVTESVYNMSGSLVDAGNGTWQKLALSGNTTLTFSLPAGKSVFLSVVPGAHVLDVTNVNEWIGSSAPSTIEAEHLFVFWSDDGVTVSGSSLGGIG